MYFLLKTLFCLFAFLPSFFFVLPAHAQWRAHSARVNAPHEAIPKDSIQKYWIDMLDNGNFLWTGISMGIVNPNFMRFADEATFIPKKKNDIYGLRLRLSYSTQYAGLPTSYNREVSMLYGKVHKGYKFMLTASAGLSFIWGRKWLEQIGSITTQPVAGLRRNSGTYPLYTAEKFWTVGVPIRTQALFIAGKEWAFGFTLGSTLNVKQIWGDAMLTVLLGIN